MAAVIPIGSRRLDRPSGAFKSMQETIAFLKENTPQSLAPYAYIIGGRVDELVCKEMKADYWTNDAMRGFVYARTLWVRAAPPVAKFNNHEPGKIA